VGAFVKTPDGRGTVTEVNLLTGILKVQSEKDPEAAPRNYKRDEVKLIRDSQIRVDAKEIRELKGLEG